MELRELIIIVSNVSALGECQYTGGGGWGGGCKPLSGNTFQAVDARLIHHIC